MDICRDYIFVPGRSKVKLKILCSAVKVIIIEVVLTVQVSPYRYVFFLIRENISKNVRL